ncbi:MAG: response regulator [Leptolyngbyaceae cyanobacterium bins.302]|nr:response regulator [Leptolyngbyaceae cyanobacterium bins.302]
MSSTSISYINTARTLASISQQRATGELTLAQDAYPWRLYFFQGRLVYATGTLHRVRRWRRAIKRHCPDFSLTFAGRGEPWEYQLLSQSVAQGILNIAQAQAVAKMSLEEVLFSWVRNPILRSEWSAVQRFSFKENAALSLLLSSTEVEQVLDQAQLLWKQWKGFELESLNPCKSPVLTGALRSDSGSAPQILANLSPYLTGRYTLWDIACYARRPVTTVTRFLLPWVQRGAITLEDVDDLPNPFLRLSESTHLGSQPYRPLIACVDDSPTVGQFLANMLEPAGYRVLKIQDPLLGIATLSKYKPDLILMDLVMPNASGYDVCNFLRKTPVFQNTPIIILTSQNGLVDRTRAKLAGASDFLSKPPEPQILLNLVRQHLQSVMSTVDDLSYPNLES